MPSLENQLETAYAAVARANEPALADVPVRLATLLLAQAPLPGDDGAQEDVEQVPSEYVLLMAKRREESRPNTGVFEVELMLEAAANAEAASADGGRLDAIFSALIRPLFYKAITDDLTGISLTLFQALSAAVDNFKCFGMPHRADSTDMNQEGSMVKRMATAHFLCVSITP